MAKFDAYFGAWRTEGRRIRLFLTLMLPLAAALGSLLVFNAPKRAAPERPDEPASLKSVMQEVCGAIGMSETFDIDQDGRPVPPPYKE